MGNFPIRGEEPGQRHLRGRLGWLGWLEAGQQGKNMEAMRGPERSGKDY